MIDQWMDIAVLSIFLGGSIIGYAIGRLGWKTEISELFDTIASNARVDDSKRREAEQVRYASGYLDGYSDGKSGAKPSDIFESDRSLRGRILDRFPGEKDAMSAYGVTLDLVADRHGIHRGVVGRGPRSQN